MDKLTNEKALLLIKTAIESKAITLQGSTGTLQGCQESAKRDATYLLTLLHHLSADEK